MSFQCLECQKVLKTKKSLKRHMETQHHSPKEPAGKEIKILEIKMPATKKPASPEPKGYHCNNCGAALSKGQTPCPACGEALNWEGIE